jgi:type II secretory pathway pseudopilin PulG
MIEIMVVVALVGVLMVIAIPAFMKSRGTAQVNTCISNLEQIDRAIQSWALDLKRTTGEPVSYDDISSYLKHGVTCPAGGSSFADSYTISTVNAPPVCQRQPATHKLAQ